MTNGEGSKYLETKTLRTAEIAKLIRADIKAAIKSGELPTGLKVSVRTDSFAGGSAIRISVTACPVQIWTEEYLASDPNKFFEGDRRTQEAVALLEKLQAFHRAYNFDHSDIQSDYFHVRYYGDASFCWKLEKADREATIARKSAETKAVATAASDEVAAIQARLDATLAKKAELETQIDALRVSEMATLAEMAALIGCHAGAA